MTQECGSNLLKQTHVVGKHIFIVNNFYPTRVDRLTLSMLAHCMFKLYSLNCPTAERAGAQVSEYLNN